MARKARRNGPYGSSGYCSICGLAKDHDLYVLDELVLCGDCRFLIRTGSYPRYESKRAYAGAARQEAERLIGTGYGHVATHTQGRFIPTEVVSLKHAELLLEIDAESKASID